MGWGVGVSKQKKNAMTNVAVLVVTLLAVFGVWLSMLPPLAELTARHFGALCGLLAINLGAAWGIRVPGQSALPDDPRVGDRMDPVDGHGRVDREPRRR